MEMTKREQVKRRKAFLRDGATILTLAKMDALELGLPKTAKAIDRATKALGFELADLLKKRLASLKSN